MTGHRINSKPKRVTNTFAAGKLNVTREHLSRVLHGHRASKRLIRDYIALLTQEGAPLPELPALKKDSPHEN